MSKPRILIVDDEIDICELLAFQFEDEGYEVETACCFNEAVDKFALGYQDIIVSDMRMPGGTGLELFRQLKRDNPNFSAKFFILTGFSSKEDEGLVSEGITACLTKPIGFDELLRQINS